MMAPERSASATQHTGWRTWIAPLAFALLALTFTFDLSTQQGFAHGILYLPVVLIALLGRNSGVLMAITLTALVLVPVAGWLSPPPPAGFPLHLLVANRVAAMFALLLAMAVGLFTLRLQRRLVVMHEKAQSQANLLEIAGQLGQLGGWSYDLRTMRVDWSAEVARLHGRPSGYQPDVEEGLSYYLDPDQSRIEAMFNACLQSGEPFDDEFQLRAFDGQVRWVRVAARAQTDPRGKIIRLQGAFQDVSAHKNTQRLLVESAQSWRRLAEAMPFIVWTTDSRGHIDYISPAVTQLSGVSQRDALGEGWLDLVHPDDRSNAISVWTDARLNRQRYENVFRLRDRNSQYRWHLARAIKQHILPDMEKAWCGTAIDIHDRVELERNAVDSRNRYEAVLESTNDAVLALDADWRVTVVNSRAANLLQRDRQDLIGRTVWEEFPQARGSLFQREYERCQREQVMVRFEEFFAPLDALFEVTAYPGQDGGVTIFFRDVTELRRVAEQIRQLRRLEAIGQLTGGVAHDFNNLLTVVMGNAEMLRDQSTEGSIERELVDTITEAAARGAAMTQRLLAFARKQALSPAPVDVNRLVSEMEPLLRRALGEHIRIEAVEGVNLWPALVDAGQMENALLNMAINARDAMPNGGNLLIECNNVHLDSTYADKNPGAQVGDYVVVTVTDTGTGMTPEVQQRLFEPFFTTKPKGQGTGLGLSMVHGFVKQSSGHVTVYSELGQGTAMKIYIPRADAAPAKSVAPTQEEVPQGRGELVLLVEDDDMVRQFASAQLHALGYRTLTAASGLAALELFGQHPDIDLLFTDVVMPGGMSGRNLADHIHSLRPNLPVLYTSGYTDNAIVHQGRLDAGVMLLTKPYRRGELAQRLRQALSPKGNK
ncbi:sensory box protein [Hydrogenophaga sp. RAC07]|uniref:hybrid sensor histidine kinase/response regulator n=1 Tax=Hydrogenophaga sp. RAC07 TaxID=1842537 RepID=UPI00083D8796|nr:PAS domain S-box protein [Hydrogenophaga sp. RAC07]AOF87379.1 sensory box protein [Hydrogenophaga sp. RAC07]